MIQVIPYLKKYHAGVVELITGTQKEFEIPVTYEQQPDLHDIENFYQVGSGNFWVAVDDEKVVGTIALIDMGKNRGTIRKMFVDPAKRGKGVALPLLEKLETWCVEKKIQTLFLGTTSKFLAAHRFYEKNGYSKIVVEQLPHDFQRMKVDTIFYTKILF
jgi:N-acetylglutamate synthase-like GNAT family acetyltransferase